MILQVKQRLINLNISIMACCGKSSLNICWQKLCFVQWSCSDEPFENVVVNNGFSLTHLQAPSDGAQNCDSAGSVHSSASGGSI